MRNKRTLRYGLASVVLFGGALGGTLAACGDDDNAVTVRPDGGQTPTDSGRPDAIADSGPGVPPAKIQLVNAATDLGTGSNVHLAGNPLRVCYAVGTTEANVTIPGSLAPTPDTKTERQPFPGVFSGTGGPVPSTGINLTELFLVPYIINAVKLQELTQAGVIKGRQGVVPGTPCRDIFIADAGGALTEGVDVWKLAAIPANTLISGKSYILLLTGCSGNATQPAAKCGPGFTNATPNGNLKATVFELDKATAVGGSSFGAQFIHASPPAQVTITDAGLLPGFVIGDAGTGDAGFRSITNGQRILPLAPITPVAQSTVDFATDNFAFLPSGLPTQNFSQIAEATFGDPDAAPYRNGSAFTFVALGDPQRGADRKTAEFFHVIALPNDPVIVTVQ